MIKNKIVMLIFFSSLIFAETTRSQVIMGTFCNITLEEKNKKQIQEGFTLLKEIELSLSSYDKKAKVYKLNHQEKVMSDKYLTEILEKSRDIYNESSGYFDITIGSVTKGLYHFGENEQVPSQKELDSARVELKGIVENNGTIRLEKGIKLDLGGIGKGYGVDKVAQYYAEQNITKGKISLSGDIRCLDICNFSIQNPFEENSTLMTLKSKISNLSISTSGTYRRYIKEKKYHHLIDPKTKKQGRVFVSVTLLTHADNSKIDALATAISVMNEKDALFFLLRQPSIAYILVKQNGERLRGNLEKFAKIYK